jgi:ATP-dependent exoDNAse (exonuclease V) alpha subunit
LKLAFAMTINKSQGQTFKYVGLHLVNDVFAHGQLYTGSSRVRRMIDLKVQLNPDRLDNKVKNVVYKELLED